MFDVICMGSATIDLFININPKFKNCNAGEKILIEDLDHETGGGGTNSAVALSRLGLKTAYLGKLGDDHNAERILKELKQEKVKIIPVKKSNKRTSFSVVMESSKEKDRIIYTYKGASNDLSLEDFDKRKVKTRWLYVATLLGKSCKTAEKIILEAKKKKTKILFNPSEYLAKRNDLIKTILKNTNILVLNKHEAQVMTKTKKDVKELAKLIKATGPKIVIITTGSKGVHCFDEKDYYYLPSKKTKVVSTAGCGDAFTSGFLAGIIKNKNIKESLEIGIENATSVIKHIGTKNKLLKWEEV